jgi:hypothetical protein
MMQRSRLIAQYTAIALTYKIKGAGSQRAGEIMALVFFLFLVLCLLVVCDCIYNGVQYGMVSRSLKLGP